MDGAPVNVDRYRQASTTMMTGTASVPTLATVGSVWDRAEHVIIQHLDGDGIDTGVFAVLIARVLFEP